MVKPDLVAPGNLVDSDLSTLPNNLLATLPTEYPSNIVDNLTIYSTAAISNYNGNPTKLPAYFRQPNYLTLSGTSMAAAVTSGAAALLLSSEPNLTPDQVKARLMLSASKNFTSFGANYFSYVTKAQQVQQEIADINTLTIPVMQQAAQQAQANLNTASGNLQKAQQAQASAAAAVSPAQTVLAQAQSAYDAAQQTLASVQTTDQQLWSATNDANTILLNDSNALNAAKQCAGSVQSTAAQKAACQAQVTTLTAQVAADNTAYQNAQNAAKTEDGVVAQANSAVGNAQTAVNQAQTNLQKMQGNLTAANSSLASAQTAYNTADLPASNLAAEQALIVTLQQQLTQYQALAGTNTDVALAQAQQYQQQAQIEIKYVLPPLQTAAAQAQNALNSAATQLQTAQAAQAASVACGAGRAGGCGSSPIGLRRGGIGVHVRADTRLAIVDFRQRGSGHFGERHKPGERESMPAAVFALLRHEVQLSDGHCRFG